MPHPPAGARIKILDRWLAGKDPTFGRVRDLMGPEPAAGGRVNGKQPVGGLDHQAVLDQAHQSHQVAGCTLPDQPAIGQVEALDTPDARLGGKNPAAAGQGRLVDLPHQAAAS